MSSEKNRGFASMNSNKQRGIASKGGVAAHQKGTAHEWDKEEAAGAGKKGGSAAASNKAKRRSRGMCGFMQGRGEHEQGSRPNQCVECKAFNRKCMK